MSSIGTRIIEIFKERGMTQKEFSEKTGIPQSTISDWRGKGLNPNVDKIMVICEALSVTPQDLLSGEKSNGNHDVDFLYIDKDSPEYNLVIEYRKLKKEDRMRLIGYMEALKKIDEKHDDKV